MYRSLILILLLAIALCNAEIRGVKKSDESKYSGETITCADAVGGIRTIPISLLNDDYCDCPYDGVDEPATGACQSGKFYCANKGWRGKYIYASAVNDGVCDCCDGSDEWKSGSCNNVCEELGKASTVHLEEKLNTILTGVKIRNDLINDAKNSRKEREERKIQLEAKFTDRQAIADALRKRVEEEEKLEKEENEKREKEAQEKAAAEAALHPTNNDPVNPPTTTEGDASANPTDAPAPSTPPPSPDTPVIGGGDDEEEGGTRFTRKRRHGKRSRKVTAEATTETASAPAEKVGGEEKVEAEVAAFPYPAEYAYQPNAATTDDNQPSVEENQEEEDDEVEEPVKEAEPAARANLYVSEAAKLAREALDAAEKKLERTRVKLDEAKRLLETDFGVDDQFFSLYKACFSLTHKQYTYEMCPYEDAKQKESGSTSLGTWGGYKINVINGKNTVVFSFTGGQGCWQGPARSLDVNLHCGEFNKILSVEEPSKCVYLMQFETPTVCTEDEVKAIRTEIDKVQNGLDE